MTDAFASLKYKINFTIAAFLDVKPGMRVVDTCAGAGKRYIIAINGE
jgi:hypothetical protein